jgi:hypothetical protein
MDREEIGRDNQLLYSDSTELTVFLLLLLNIVKL